MQEFAPTLAHSLAVIFLQTDSSPEEFILNFINKFSTSSLEESLVVCSYTSVQVWDKKLQTLESTFFLSSKQNLLMIDQVSISKNHDLFLLKSGLQVKFGNEIITVNNDAFFYQKVKSLFVEANSSKFYFKMRQPFLLKPIFIPKPWGQEIWFSGVEKRGVSEINSPQSPYSIPIPWFFGVLPKTMLGTKYWNKSLVLIKVLDPWPDEVFGDLYYELHQEKNEVYVVTEIASNKGQIKMGISQSKLNQYSNNISQLKIDLLTSIENYEKVRREIDTLFDTFQSEEELSSSSPIPVVKIKEWYQKIPAKLKSQEELLRKNMDEFAGFLDLQVGDVICVPTHVPHALQHGVKVIEFQTPTYERLILSFAQKVLTQPHWDTRQAIDLMKLEPPQKAKLPQLTTNESYQEELVCSFPDFYSVRVTLKRQKKYFLKSSEFYQILFCVQERSLLSFKEDSYHFSPGECIFVPSKNEVIIEAEGDVVFLICAPEPF